jgi:hypothetical protein
VFLTLLVIGLVGLVMMAIPALGRHGHAPSHGAPGAPGHALGHGAAAGGARLLGSGARGPVGGHLLGAGARGPVGGHLLGAGVRGPATTTPTPGQGDGGTDMIPADAAPAGWLRFVPSPRAVFSVLALYGAAGNALVEAAHLAFLPAVLLALLPALAVERFLVRPLWNLLFRFQGQPSSSLEELLFAEAEAVVPFRNGRGLVAVIRDGRLVQLSARLRADQAALPIKVGERLRIEDIDARHERVTVSVLRG